MAKINYRKESEKFRPSEIETLLIAEAPPASGTRYFYVPRAMSTKKLIEKDASLAATIFNHYGLDRPSNLEQYMENLIELKNAHKVFLIDILDKPLRIRGNKRNERILIKEIPKLKRKMKRRGIRIEEKDMIFLLARKSYKSRLKEHFPEAQFIPWIKFRIKSS